MKSHCRLFVGFGLAAFVTLGARPAAAQSSLMWAQYTTRPIDYTFEGAFQAAANHTEGGHSDWRVPTLEELQAAAQDGSLGLRNEGGGFTGNQRMWTSTGVGNGSRSAWVVRVSWVDGESVPSEGAASKVLIGSLLHVKFVRDVTACGGPADCDDDDPCTIDDCVGGVCVNDSIDCDDGDACTTDGCSGGVCFNDAIDCDDGDACSADSCDPGSGCANTFPACGFSDGCCGPACDPGNDPDCASCGAHNDPCIFNEDCCSGNCRWPSNKCSKP